jgi:hypothetical protein
LLRLAAIQSDRYEQKQWILLQPFAASPSSVRLSWDEGELSWPRCPRQFHVSHAHYHAAASESSPCISLRGGVVPLRSPCLSKPDHHSFTLLSHGPLSHTRAASTCTSSMSSLVLRLVQSSNLLTSKEQTKKQMAIKDSSCKEPLRCVSCFETSQESHHTFHVEHDVELMDQLVEQLSRWRAIFSCAITIWVIAFQSQVGLSTALSIDMSTAHPRCITK